MSTMIALFYIAFDFILFNMLKPCLCLSVFGVFTSLQVLNFKPDVCYILWHPETYQGRNL